MPHIHSVIYLLRYIILATEGLVEWQHTHISCCCCCCCYCRGSIVTRSTLCAGHRGLVCLHITTLPWNQPTRNNYVLCSCLTRLKYTVDPKQVLYYQANKQ
jgi:hypothetical protein